MKIEIHCQLRGLYLLVQWCLQQTLDTWHATSLHKSHVDSSQVHCIYPCTNCAVSGFVQKSDLRGFPHSPQRTFYKIDTKFATFHSSGTQANVSNRLRISVNHSPGVHLGCCSNVGYYPVLLISCSSFLADSSTASPAEVSTLISSCASSLAKQIGLATSFLCALLQWSPGSL